MPLGLYGRESDVIGIDSVEVEHGSVSNFLRDATKFLRHLEEQKPGWGGVFEIVLGTP